MLPEVTNETARCCEEVSSYKTMLNSPRYRTNQLKTQDHRVCNIYCVNYTRMQTHFSADWRAPTKICHGKFNLITVIKRPACF